MTKPKYYGDRVCNCGREIPYGRKECICKPIKESITNIVKSWLGDCTCHSSYKDRKLKDPTCQWCGNKEMIDELVRYEERNR